MTSQQKDRSKMFYIFRLGSKSLFHTIPQNIDKDSVTLLPYEDIGSRWNEFENYAIPGGKWQGILKFFDRQPERLSPEAYYFFPDDDLDFSGFDLSAFEAVIKKYRPMLAQPTLCLDSHFSYAMTLDHGVGIKFRPTNFVEQMAPVISGALLIRCMPELRNLSEYGYDVVLSAMAEKMGTVGCIDGVTVTHTRPVTVRCEADQEIAYAESLTRTKLKEHLKNSVSVADKVRLALNILENKPSLFLQNKKIFNYVFTS